MGAGFLHGVIGRVLGHHDSRAIQMTKKMSVQNSVVDFTIHSEIVGNKNKLLGHWDVGLLDPN